MPHPEPPHHSESFKPCLCRRLSGTSLCVIAWSLSNPGLCLRLSETGLFPYLFPYLSLFVACFLKDLCIVSPPPPPCASKRNIAPQRIRLSRQGCQRLAWTRRQATHTGSRQDHIVPKSTLCSAHMAQTKWRPAAANQGTSLGASRKTWDPVSSQSQSPGPQVPTPSYSTPTELPGLPHGFCLLFTLNWR